MESVPLDDGRTLALVDGVTAGQKYIGSGGIEFVTASAAVVLCSEDRMRIGLKLMGVSGRKIRQRKDSMIIIIIIVTHKFVTTFRLWCCRRWQSGHTRTVLHLQRGFVWIP